MMTWEGMSSQGKQYYDRSRGLTIHGTGDGGLIDRDGYQVFSLDDKKIDAIREGEKLHSPIEEGNVSVTMLQLSNIAWKVGRTLALNESNGHIADDAKAMELWRRDYEEGWELKI